MTNDKSAAAPHRNPVIQDLIVTGGGFIASTATAWALYAMERWWNFSLYSLMVWFVLPAGAVAAGMGAAAGYYAGARIADTRPSRGLLVNMVLVAATTFLAIHWLRYEAFVIDAGLGGRVSFWRYLDVALQHQSMTLRVHGAALGSTDELGLFGYAIAALQILGFALGGFLVYGALAKLPFCERCARYLSARGQQKRFADTPDSFEAMASAMVARWREGDMQGALDLHRNWGVTKVSKTCKVQSTLERKQCPGCRVNWLRYRAERFDGRDWKSLPGLDFSRYHEGDLST